MLNVMAAQPNIGGALCESSLIPFLVPRRKGWLTPLLECRAVKVKFHYAILLASWFASTSWNLAYHALSSSLTGLRPGRRSGLRPG